MKHALTIGAFIVGLLGWLGTAQAELRVHQDRLTVDLQEVSLEHALEDLARQGSIAITILEGDDLDNAFVTKQFANLSIEEGLHQLLLGWNYGLTKDRVTGRVQNVLIASERTENLNELPVTAPAASPPVTQQQAAPSYSYEEEPNADPLDEFYRDGEPTNEVSADHYEEFTQDISDKDEFPDKTNSDDLPPDVRQAMLRVLHDIADSR